MASRCIKALVSSMMITAAFGVSRRLKKDPQTFHVSFDQDGVPVSFDIPNGKVQAPAVLSASPVLTNGTHCLNFLHVPKSGGTTVEDRNATGLKDGPDWGKQDETLHCKGMHSCPDVQPWRGHTRCCPMEDGNICSVWHVPPSMDKELEKHYAQCETFCIVRDPAARFRSQHVWSLRKEVNRTPPACSTESLSDAVDRKFHELEKQPYTDDCHFIPQVEYWRNGQGCQHVIKMENLEADFSRLVARFGMKAEFHNVENPQSNVHCDAAFDKKSSEKLQRHYAADYEAFGYTRSFV